MIEMFSIYLSIIICLIISNKYNAKKLNEIRKDIVERCYKELINKGYEVNKEEIYNILEFSRNVDDSWIRLMSIVPFVNLLISFNLLIGKVKKEYMSVEKHLFDDDVIVNLKKMNIIKKEMKSENDMFYAKPWRINDYESYKNLTCTNSVVNDNTNTKEDKGRVRVLKR